LRQETRASLDRVATMADSLFVSRVLAGEARKKGLLDDPEIVARSRQIVEAYEAHIYLEDFEKNLPVGQLEARAREIYLADRPKFRVPDQFAVDHILVNLWARTPEMALARVKEARAKLIAGAVLEDVAKEYGGDGNPRGAPATGKLGIVSADKVDVAIGERLASLKVGEWSQPILTRVGYHIVRVTSRIPGSEIPFEKAKAAIVEQERAKLTKKLTDEKLQAIRNAPGTRIDSEALKQLVQALPKEEIERRQREAVEAAARAAAAGTK
jgi:parvulin-like peptidyl-prolyl isomerase